MSASRFLRIACPKCGRTHVVFGKATTMVKCHSCNALLMKPTGGKTQVKAQVKDVLWK
ncbi:MAG TPA: 30S ribosomal protein S27e [Candidatus Nanoarchaeia archaeon]|nr:30S ribosomal protein S27e [Candidatus Nanoarchaeia archaeon]